MSAEQREALEAGLRQAAFPPESDISEQQRLLQEPAAGQPGSRQAQPRPRSHHRPDAALDVIVLDGSADKARLGAGRPGLCASSFVSSEAPWLIN